MIGTNLLTAQSEVKNVSFYTIEKCGSITIAQSAKIKEEYMN